MYVYVYICVYMYVHVYVDVVGIYVQDQLERLCAASSGAIQVQYFVTREGAGVDPNIYGKYTFLSSVPSCPSLFPSVHW